MFLKGKKEEKIEKNGKYFCHSKIFFRQRWKNIFVRKIFFHFFSTFSPSKTLTFFTKKAKNLKKHSDSIFIHVSLQKNVSTSDLRFPKLLSRKKGTSETFLSLGLFISQPWPTASASKIRLRLRITFPPFPFFYFGNLGKTSIRRGQIFPRSSQHNYQNKILRTTFINCELHIAFHIFSFIMF